MGSKTARRVGPPPRLLDTLRTLSSQLGNNNGRLRILRSTTSRLGETETLWAVWGGQLRCVALLSPEEYSELDGIALMQLEYSLREEILDIRGWDVSLESLNRNVPERRWFAYLHIGKGSKSLGKFAESPAHAMSLVLSAALFENTTRPSAKVDG